MRHDHKLKILSGILDGVEFTLADGDTVFSIGAPRALHDGALQGSAWEQADNVFYIPDDTRRGLFRIRCSGADVVPQLQLQDDAGGWQLQTLAWNEVTQVHGLAIAVRAADQPWLPTVLDYRLPVPAGPAGQREPRRARGRPPLKVLLVLAVMLVAGFAGWLYERNRPAAQIRGLEAVLAGSPHAYAVAHDGHGGLYAFSDSVEAAAWGQRASARAGRGDDHYRVRGEEAERIGILLETAGLEHAVVRLRDPARPEIVLTAAGGDDAARRQRAARLLEPQMPYARQLDIRAISDARLVAIAREALRARGIGTRVVQQAGRSAVSNDVFLDDAGLHAMAAYRRDFARQWGERRVRINIRLWDDLLKGRSFQYSQDQLLSVGEGRWEFSTASP